MQKFCEFFIFKPEFDYYEVHFIWPRKRIIVGIDNFEERKIQVNLKQKIPKHISTFYFNSSFAFTSTDEKMWFILPAKQACIKVVYFRMVW